MADPYAVPLGRLAKTKKILEAASKGKSGEKQLLATVRAIVHLIRTWKKKGVGKWQDAVAVVAWRERLEMRHGSDGGDGGSVRALARYLTGCKPRAASQIAVLVRQTRKHESSEVASLIRAAGGIDKVSFRGGKVRAPKLQPGKGKVAKPKLNGG